MKHSTPILDALAHLAQDERDLLASTFVAPAIRGGAVTVRMKGVRCVFKIHPEGFDGWGVFRAIAHDRAALVRMATPGERMKYLRQYPAACLVLSVWRYPHWDAVLANLSDRRFPVRTTAPVCFAGTAQRFDTVRARFDGKQFLFESLHPRADADLAALLRKTLEWGIDPDRVKCPQLTPALRKAYAIAHRALHQRSGRGRK
jgi:hypothetical protein